jgi:hypothetical protein
MSEISNILLQPTTETLCKRFLVVKSKKTDNYERKWEKFISILTVAQVLCLTTPYLTQQHHFICYNYCNFESVRTKCSYNS